MDTIRRNVTRAAIGAIVIGMSVTGSACVPAPSVRASSCRVSIVGDSLAVGVIADARLSRELAARGCSLGSADGRGSRRSDAGASAVESLARSGRLAPMLVVVLGTNDCSGTTVQAQAQRILRAAGGRPVLWAQTWHRCSASVNAGLARAAAQSNGQMSLLSTASMVRQAGVRRSGDVHLTPRGYDRFARLLADAARWSAE